MFAIVLEGGRGLEPWPEGVAEPKAAAWEGASLPVSGPLGAPPESLPPLVTPVHLLEARFGDLEGEALARVLLRSLRELGAVEARLDLALGEGLARLVSRDGERAMGHSHVSALCEGRLGFSSAHGRELRRLATRLHELPPLRDAFLSGLVPRTRVREVLACATAETAAEWALAAQGLSTRELRRLVVHHHAECNAPPDHVPAGRERLAWLGTAEDFAEWRFGLAAVRQVAGITGPDWLAAEALAAEVLSSCEPGPETDVGSPAATALARRVELLLRPPRGMRALPSAQAEATLRRALFRLAAVPEVAVPDFSACVPASDLCSALEGLARRRRVVEWERARLLAWMQGRALHRRLGTLRFTELTDRALGLAPSDVMLLIDRQRDASLHPKLDAAWREGLLSATLVGQLVKAAETLHGEAWIRWAARSTPRKLAFALEQACVSGGEPGPPPDGVRAAELALDWQAHFGLRRKGRLDAIAEGAASLGGDACAAGVGCPGGDACAEGVGCPGGDACAAGVGSPRGHGAPLFQRLRGIGFTAPAEVAGLFRQAQAAVRRDVGGVLSDADVARHLVRHFLAVHVTDAVLKRAAAQRVMDRDAWICSMPHCTSRGPFHAHHVVFRSQGGSDDDWNLTTLCTACHAMVHDGFVVIRGRAPDGLEFLVGPGGPPGDVDARNVSRDAPGADVAMEIYRNDELVGGWRCRGPAAVG